MGAASSLALPADLPNAWCDDQPHEPPACYGSVGYMGLRRERLGHSAVAVFDFQSGGIDTGLLPPRNSPLAGNFNDIDPRLSSGVRTSIGYHWDNYAIEASGFYIGQTSASRTFASLGRFDTFFNVNGNFFSFPLGFEGDNGMWLQDDIIRLRLQTAVGSAEANFRYWPKDAANHSWSVGVRYLDIYERFGFYTGDDDLTVIGINGSPDPTRQALYLVTSHNHIVAPQLGWEGNWPLSCWMAISVMAKGAWGVNFVDVDTLLRRGDGFVGFAGHRSETIFSHLYELGLYLDFSLAERVRLRAGYNFLWAVDVAEAVDQFDFNLANQQGRRDNHGSIFYQGPVVEMHFLF